MIRKGLKFTKIPTDKHCIKHYKCQEIMLQLLHETKNVSHDLIHSICANLKSHSDFKDLRIC